VPNQLAAFAAVVALSAAGCATPKTAESPDAATESVTLELKSATPQTWETWPPAETGQPHASRPSGDGKTIRLVPKDGGWRVDELFDLINKTTGASILYDGNNATFKQAKVEFVGAHVIAESDLFAWLQAVLSYRKLVLVPVGPKSPDGRSQWFVMDQADPNLKSRPMFIDESQIFDVEDRDGLYVVTTLRCRDTVDTTRVRNALSPLSTQTAGIGRIQDIPGSRVLIVGDFAPVVAAMKRSLDIINANSPPSAVRPAPTPAPAAK
jgi:hypothetical protein